MSKIPLHIVSGFLGSGKTTFLKRVLKSYSQSQKIGVIQNEFAPVSIDSRELNQTGYSFELLEINNGSAFCVCLLGGFVQSLQHFIEEKNPDVILIEASGLSDVTSVGEIISAQPLSSKIYLASNWCIVDGYNFLKLIDLNQRVAHQIRMADVVVLNKSDLIADNSEAVSRKIRLLNPFCEIQAAAYCNVDFVLGNAALSKYYFRPVAPLGRPDINSMVLKTSLKISAASLQLFLTKWAPVALRIKGFVNLNNGKTAVVNCVFGSIEMALIDNQLFPTEMVALADTCFAREWETSFRELSCL